MLRLAFAAAVAGAGVGCANPAACESTAASCAPPTTQTVELGQEFDLAPGQIGLLKGTIVSVTFAGVNNDSRCPSDAVCVWAGDAAAQLRVDLSDAQLWSGELHTTLNPKAAAAGSYDLTLIGVSPAPRSTVKIAPSDYRVRLRLTAK